MTKRQFENHKKPLGLIVSIDIETGDVLYETYDWRTIDSFKKDFERDFPKMIHLTILNKEAINERKRLYGIVV